jgi:hypothetical protein
LPLAIPWEESYCMQWFQSVVCFIWLSPFSAFIYPFSCSNSGGILYLEERQCVCL